MNFEQLIGVMDAELYERLQQAVATGRWADGVRLTETQREQSMQLVIGWQLKHGLSPFPSAGECRSSTPPAGSIPVISKD